MKKNLKPKRKHPYPNLKHYCRIARLHNVVDMHPTKFVCLILAALQIGPLGGILALSTYLTLPARIGRSADSANGSIPIFMGHGTLDPVVPVQLGELARQQLTGLGYQVQWHTYPMQHAVCMEEIRDIGTWLQSLL